MEKQSILYESGNELASYAAKQIRYHVMGYYPITPSTQIAENLELISTDVKLIAAEGEHSAAGICYGASVGGGRVFNATSANGLLYALEQFPVQAGTRFPMVMNVACRTVSGPLCIKGDHSDIMYMLNTGWIILFADEPQAVYDFNLLALKLAEQVLLPVAVAFDGFYTSHQKRKCLVFAEDATVQNYIGKKQPYADLLDLAHPITVGSYMNEPDVLNNKYQLHQAMEHARTLLPKLFDEYRDLSGRNYTCSKGYRYEDATVLLFILGSAYHTAMEAVDILRKEGVSAGVITISVLRPFPAEELASLCRHAQVIISADRQDSYGAGGGNMSLELRSCLQQAGINTRVISRIYGLGGLDFFVEDAITLFREGLQQDVPSFAYHGIVKGLKEHPKPPYFAPLAEADTCTGITACTYHEDTKRMEVNTKSLAAATAMPDRLAPGHGACPGCGIPVNVKLLLKGIEGNVVLLFQTGCGMVVTTSYPKTSFKVPYLHNLFQNGAATLSGLVEVFHERQRRGEYPQGHITFIMVSGDGGMDIGMGSALGTALRGHGLILFEYDNGGYMNTGYQLSYSTPMGAKSATSHVGPDRCGKGFFHKDMPEIMAATHLPYVATVAESNPMDFIKKAAKAAAYAKDFGTAYLKALSACPLNWGDAPDSERDVISAAVDCCYFPLYEVEQGITTLNYDPEKGGKKIPVTDWFSMMGRTKHLAKTQYREITEKIQAEVDRRFQRIKMRSENPLL